MAVFKPSPLFGVPQTSAPPQKFAAGLSSNSSLRNKLALNVETQLHGSFVVPMISPKPIVFDRRAGIPFRKSSEDFDVLSVAFPCFAHSNTLCFSSAYNCQVIVGDNEPEERLIGRFRREVSKAGVLRECKRRRYFETSQERRRRKTREAAQKNRKRRPRPKVDKSVKVESCKPKEEDSKPDNWEYLGIELPYC